MKKNIYLILLISFVLYQTLSCSMDRCRQIDMISKPHSFAWIDDSTLAITNNEACYLLDLQNDNPPITLCTGYTTIDCVFDNNQKILLSKIRDTDTTLQSVICDLTTKNEILPPLRENCLLSCIFADKLILTSQCTVIDTDNQEYALPNKFDTMKHVASSGQDLLFVPDNSNNRAPTQEKWTLVNVESLTQPKIEEICPTFLKDNPKNVLNAFYSHDGTCLAFKTTPHKENAAFPWFIYNFITDTLSEPINCSRLTISPNNSTAAYLSNEHKNKHKIVFFDIKLNQTICSLPFTTEDFPGSRLTFSPNGTQIAILPMDQYYHGSQIFLTNVPTEALNPPSKRAIYTRLFLLKTCQDDHIKRLPDDHIKRLPNEILSLIMKKLVSLFGYAVRT